MSFISKIKDFFKYDHKLVVKNYFEQELSYIYNEILQEKQRIKKLEEKRDELEEMLYGC